MKGPSPLRPVAYAIIGLIVGLPILAWLGAFIECVRSGSRNDILRAFPNAEIRPAYAPNLGAGGFMQALMPKGYLLEGVRAVVVIKGGEVSFKVLGNMNISSLHVTNCKISDWEAVVLNEPLGMGIYVSDSTFVGGDDEYRRMLMKFRKEDSVTGEILYHFGSRS